VNYRCFHIKSVLRGGTSCLRGGWKNNSGNKVGAWKRANGLKETGKLKTICGKRKIRRNNDEM